MGTISWKTYKDCLREEINCDGKKRLWSLSDAKRSVLLIRRMQLFSKCTLLKRYYRHKLVKDYGIFVSPETVIGKGIRLPHPNGIIIGQASIIGERVTLFQQVTIGSARSGDVKLGLQPQIGNDVIIYSGAKVIGNIRIGDDCKIGANSVITKDTSNGTTWVGNPARKAKGRV